MDTSTFNIGTPESGTDWVPVHACTLPAIDQPTRVAEFDELFATSLREVQRAGGVDTRVRLVLAGDEALPTRVQRLVDAENSCCSFFTFTLTLLDAGSSSASGCPGETELALDIKVPPAHSRLLGRLVTGAAAARQLAS